MSEVFLLPPDEPKEKVKWQERSDFIDGSPRYTFEGRDPATTIERFQVAIYAEKKREYAHDPRSSRYYYTGYVCDSKLETSDTVGPFKYLRDAKRETLKLFNSYMEDYAKELEEREGNREDAETIDQQVRIF